jgi:hypothetical protein
MATNTTPKRLGAILLGVVFAGGTAAVVFSDVEAIEHVTLDHMMTALVLLGTLASGHMFWQQARQWRIGSAIGLALMFIAGTGYLVTTSAARNADSTAGKLAQVRTANSDRAALEKDLNDAKAKLEAAQAKRDDACNDGVGRLCKGAKANVTSREEDVAKAENKLRGGPIAKVENAGLKHAALVYSILTGLDPAGIERALDLLFPFVKATFLELGTIVFFGIGFRHEAGPAVPVDARPVSQPVSLGTESEFASADKVIDWVREFRAKHGRDPQIPELQGEFLIPKTTAWRRIKSA